MSFISIIFICGLPLLWLAVTRLINQHWVSSALLIVMAMAACIYIGQYFAAGEVAFVLAQVSSDGIDVLTVGTGLVPTMETAE